MPEETKEFDEIINNAKSYYHQYIAEGTNKASLYQLDKKYQAWVFEIFLMGFNNGIQFFAMKHDKIINPKSFREKLDNFFNAIGAFFE